MSMIDIHHVCVAFEWLKVCSFIYIYYFSGKETLYLLPQTVPQWAIRLRKYIKSFSNKKQPIKLKGSKHSKFKYRR